MLSRASFTPSELQVMLMGHSKVDVDAVQLGAIYQVGRRGEGKEEGREGLEAWECVGGRVAEGGAAQPYIPSVSFSSLSLRP